VFGLRVDYLAPSIYLTDILFLTVFVPWMRSYHKKFLEFIEKNKIYIFLFIFIAVVNTTFSTSIFPSVYKWLKLMEIVIFYYYVRARHDIFKSKTLFATLYYSLIFFSVIGISQFILSRTLGGPLYLLGERSFDISTPGIALTQILGRNFMRSYSTFSHPNSFAGYLGLGLLVLSFTYSKKDLIKKTSGIMIICVAFLLTFSLSAAVGTALCGILYLLIRRKIFKNGTLVFIPLAFLLISLILPFVSTIVFNNKINLPQNISQRLDLSSIAGSMISQKFLLGEGLNTFVVNEPRIKHMGAYLWNLQPVHNIFLLIFSETGIIGLSFVYFLLVKANQKALLLNEKALYLVIVFVLTTGLLDHYWFTLQQNMLFLAFVFGNSFGAES
jgi:O-antigen ligase